MTEDVHHLTKDNPLLILGDSLVAGEGANGDLGWAQHFAVCRPADVVGVCGATSRDILAYLPPRAYDQVIVQIGTNDARFRHGRNETECLPEEYARNLAQIVEHFRRLNSAVDITFVDLLFVDERRTVLFKPDRSYFNANLRKMAAELAGFCGRKGLRLLSLANFPRRPEGLSDGLHPTTNSHERLFHLILTAWMQGRADGPLPPRNQNSDLSNRSDRGDQGGPSQAPGW